MNRNPAVDLVVMDDALEALALRPVLEWWGIRVTLHLIGQARDLVEILDGSTPLSNHIFLMCHGGESGFVLPVLGADFEKDQPYHGALTPSQLAEFAHLPSGCVVISTACATGNAAFAQVFLAARCRTYIAPTGYPEGSASLFYTLHLVYDWLCGHRSLHLAHAEARAHDEETRLFELFESPLSG